MTIQPNSNYKSDMFATIKPETLQKLKVNETTAKGISEKIFKEIKHLDLKKELKSEDIAAARQILVSSQNTKSESLFYRIFGGITGSKGRFEERMKELDRLEMEPFIKQLEQKPSRDGSYLSTKAFNVRDDLSKKNEFSKLTSDQKNAIYNEVIEVIKDMLRSSYHLNNSIFNSPLVKDILNNKSDGFYSDIRVSDETQKAFKRWM